jgi:hypothetical protein
LLHEPDVRLHSPLVFDLEKEGFELGQQLPPKTEQVMVNGKRYISIEQKMELYAYQNGSHVIPAITAQCKVPVKRNKKHPQFDFDDFFGRRFELYQVYSAPQTVDIKALPPSAKDVAIVGEFNSFSAHLDHKKAKVGEGSVLRLVVEGSGNAKKVSFPKLIVPSELNAYESKFDLEEYNGSWRKTFEYVVQGNTKGSYTIPAQQFTYFDLKKRDYSTLSTRPLSITITEGEILEKSSTRTKKKSPEERVAAPKGVKEESNKITLLNESATIFDTIPMIPMKYFYQLRFLLIMLALGIPKLMSWYRGSPQKRASRKARSLLSQYKKDGDVTKLYQLLFNLFAEHIGSSAVVNEQGVVTYLQAKGADADLLQRDLNQLAEASFTTYMVKDKNNLFAIVDRWIAEVEKW